MILDFHNHFFPTTYLQELAKGEADASVEKDKQGRTTMITDGDYAHLGPHGRHVPLSGRTHGPRLCGLSRMSPEDIRATQHCPTPDVYRHLSHSQKAIEFAVDFAGADKVLMGSDYPHQIGDLPGAIATIHDLTMGDSDKALVLGENARQLLAI